MCLGGVLVRKSDSSVCVCVCVIVCLYFRLHRYIVLEDIVKASSKQTFIVCICHKVYCVIVIQLVLALLVMHSNSPRSHGLGVQVHVNEDIYILTCTNLELDLCLNLLATPPVLLATFQ